MITNIEEIFHKLLAQYVEGAILEEEFFNSLIYKLHEIEMMAQMMKPKDVRSIGEIGLLWPRCRECKHIAQDHDEVGCSAHGPGQCPECGTWVSKTKCKCMRYIGPTLEEFRKLLTQNEIDYYKI